MNTVNILYLGYVNGKEAYCDIQNGQIIMFSQAWWDEKKAEAISIFEILRVPLIIGLSMVVYSILRSQNFHIIAQETYVFSFVFLAFLSGMLSSFLFSMICQKIGKERVQQGKPATQNEQRASYEKMRKDTRTVLFFLPVLIAFLIGMPFLFSKIGTILVFFGYFIGWFLFGLLWFSFHPIQRIKILRKIS